MIKPLYIFSLLVFFLSSCNVSKPTNYSFEATKNSLHPQFLVYHHSNDLSELYFKVNSEDLLYSRKNISEPFSAQLLLEYVIYKKNYKEILDSGSFTMMDKYLDNKKPEIDTNFHFKFLFSELGNIDVKITDVNRSRSYFETITIDKLKVSNRQFFILKDSSGNIIFNNYFNSGQTVFIESDFNKNNLFATNNNTIFPLSPPPFSKSQQPIFPKKTSSSQQLSFKNKRLSFTTPERGFIFFQLDTLTDLGFTLFNFRPDYPELTDPRSLIAPLRYLTTNQEYNQILAKKNPKLAVDQYWLSKAASKERARTLIRTYYSRIELANKLFTCHLEGWKTDRGLISVIFGAPSYVSQNKNVEIWNYGDDNNVNSLKFVFDRKVNPFSNNDFALKRNYSFKNPWYRAVESWRNGKVYIIQ